MKTVQFSEPEIHYRNNEGTMSINSVPVREPSKKIEQIFDKNEFKIKFEGILKNKQSSPVNSINQQGNNTERPRISRVEHDLTKKVTIDLRGKNKIIKP